jgi:hypothetical protein
MLENHFQQQSAILAADIVDKYPYETIEDVVLVLKQVRQGILNLTVKIISSMVKIYLQSFLNI